MLSKALMLFLSEQYPTFYHTRKSYTGRMKEIRLLYGILFLCLLGFTACDEEETPDWELNICNALSTEDYMKFQNVCNDYLEQNENEDIEALLEDFAEWLDDMECLDARVVCFECLPFMPPASEVEIRFSSFETENITRELVVVSFSEAMFIRVSEVR
jgi:hypothetical protein